MTTITAARVNIAEFIRQWNRGIRNTDIIHAVATDVTADMAHLRVSDLEAVLAECPEYLMRQIDGLTRLEMARKMRFAPAGDPMMNGEVGMYFQRRFYDTLGGFTPEISKAIGWSEFG